MPRTVDQQRGIEFEQIVADKLGGKVQPGSGNQFHSKSDVVANGLIVSCKSEKSMNWNNIRKQLSEAIEFSHGTGNIPALTLQDMDWKDEFILFRLEDFCKALKEVSIPETFESKGLEKRSTAEVPTLLR